MKIRGAIFLPFISLILILFSLFNYGCKKKKKEALSTIFSGQIVNADDHSAIRVNTSFGTPIVQIFRANSISLQFEEVERISVNNDGRFSQHIDFEKYIDENSDTRYDWSQNQLLFFYGITHYDTSLYIPHEFNYSEYPGLWGPGVNSITPGEDLSTTIAIEAKAWVRFHIVNKNTANNADKDIFYVLRGGFTEEGGGAPYTYFYGKVDTLCNFIRQTHSGSRYHVLHARLVRNGKKTSIYLPYTLIPFDTTIVDVEY